MIGEETWAGFVAYVKVKRKKKTIKQRGEPTLDDIYLFVFKNCLLLCNAARIRLCDLFI